MFHMGKVQTPPEYQNDPGLNSTASLAKRTSRVASARKMSRKMLRMSVDTLRSSRLEIALNLAQGECVYLRLRLAGHY